ncbi:MAG: nuclear transport factor 2 family protein [Myxococcota bacterium]
MSAASAHERGIDVADRLEIHALLDRYCHSIDAARGELCAALFLADATLETPVGVATGAVAIRAWIDERLSLRDPAIQVRHSPLSVLLAPLDADRVRVRSTLLYTWETLEIPREVDVKSTVIYEDVVRRTPDGWRFASRKCDTRIPLDDVYFR